MKIRYLDSGDVQDVTTGKAARAIQAGEAVAVEGRQTTKTVSQNAKQTKPKVARRKADGGADVSGD